MQTKAQETTHGIQPDLQFIAARENERLTALSRWTLWRKEAEGTFPKSIKIGHKRVWVKAEVLAWMADRIAERG